jgi:two-component system OmpR family sensor kinase
MEKERDGRAGVGRSLSWVLSQARGRGPELAWIAFAGANLLLMLRLSLWQTVPFHFIWLSMSILYGFRMWKVRNTALVLAAVMFLTGYALIAPVVRTHAGWEALDESTEVPLMAAIFVAMVWHARRRQSAMQQTEQALERERDAVERLRAMDEVKNTFLQAVSHDLRTPLTAILGFALSLQKEEELGLTAEDRRELAGRLAANARRLNRLVTDLLDLDRLQRGVLEPALSPTDLGALAQSVLDGLDGMPRHRIQTDVDPVIVSIDPAKVERILENLMVNASKHTPPQATIWLRVKRHEEGALIVVEDDGPGVPEGLRTTIFEPFRQAPDGAADPSPGMGIGLSLVARFAELHGGRAWVDERPGGGASFRVYLPGAAAGTPAKPFTRQTRSERPMASAS